VVEPGAMVAELLRALDDLPGVRRRSDEDAEVHAISPYAASGGASQRVGPEGHRQEVAESRRDPDSLRTAEMDARRRAGEFRELLAAAPARGANGVAFGRDRDLDDLPVASCHHGTDRAALGALGDWIRGVLHVAPRVETTARGADARADAKVRVRSV